MDKDALDWLMEYRELLAEERILRRQIANLEGELIKWRIRVVRFGNRMGLAGVNLEQQLGEVDEPDSKP
jgi:hypothetical protein